LLAPPAKRLLDSRVSTARPGDPNNDTQPRLLYGEPRLLYGERALAIPTLGP